MRAKWWMRNIEVNLARAHYSPWISPISGVYFTHKLCYEFAEWFIDKSAPKLPNTSCTRSKARHKLGRKRERKMLGANVKQSVERLINSRSIWMAPVNKVFVATRQQLHAARRESCFFGARIWANSHCRNVAHINNGINCRTIKLLYIYYARTGVLDGQKQRRAKWWTQSTEHR